MKNPLRTKKILSFVLSILFMGVSLWILLAPHRPGTFLGSVQNIFYRMDDMRYDVKVSTPEPRGEVTKSRIVIVDVDTKSIFQEGAWPWHYDKIATLIANLRKQGVRIMALDSVFSHEEVNSIQVIEDELTKRPGGDVGVKNFLNLYKFKLDGNRALISQIENYNDIILSFVLFHSPYLKGRLPKPQILLSPAEAKLTSVVDMSGYLTNFSALQSVSTHNGFIAAQDSSDGIIRQQTLLLRHNNKVYMSLALAVAHTLYPDRKIALNETSWGPYRFLTSVQFGDTAISTDAQGNVWIPGYDTNVNFKHISASDVLNNHLEPSELRSAIVFIGSSVQGQLNMDEDYSKRPLSHLEAQAFALKGILEDTFLYTPYWYKVITIAVIVLIGTFIMFIIPLLNSFRSVLITFIPQLIGLLINIIFFIQFGIVLHLAVPLVLGVMLMVFGTLVGFKLERKTKDHVRDAFSQYVPPEYMSILLDNPGAYTLEGRLVEMTVLFADIRDFTSISERLDASSVKKVLNKFFTPMTRIILKRRGTIDKYVGDMIIAFWGAPINNEHHAEAAIDAALDMLAKTEKMKSFFKTQGLPQINQGIGLNSGLMNVGDMGSKFRRSYTVIGDAVNLGSRLQSATKYYGVKLLVGSAVIKNQTKFVFRFVDKVQFKGKHDAIDVYEVVGRKSEMTPSLKQELSEYHKAIMTYRHKQWIEAVSLFEVLTLKYPDCKLYTIYLDRSKALHANPPKPHWDGVYVFEGT